MYPAVRVGAHLHDLAAFSPVRDDCLSHFLARLLRCKQLGSGSCLSSIPIPRSDCGLAALPRDCSKPKKSVPARAFSPWSWPRGRPPSPGNIVGLCIMWNLGKLQVFPAGSSSTRGLRALPFKPNYIDCTMTLKVKSAAGTLRIRVRPRINLADTFFHAFSSLYHLWCWIESGMGQARSNAARGREHFRTNSQPARVVGNGDWNHLCCR